MIEDILNSLRSACTYAGGSLVDIIDGRVLDDYWIVNRQHTDLPENLKE